MLASDLAPTPRLNVKLPDPRTGVDAEWGAHGELLDRDILLLHGMYPFGAELIAAAEQAQAWSLSKVINAGAPQYAKPEHRSSESCSPRDVAAVQPFVRTLVDLEGGLATLYAQTVNAHARVKQALGWEILRYRTGAYFKEHVDVVAGDPMLGLRILAVVLFCNDDCEGGELVFPRQGITIPPEAGACVVFPASVTHPHEVKPVTRGTRYSVVTWYV